MRPAPLPAKLTLKKPIERALSAGHPWVYRDALRHVPSLPNGALVAVCRADGHPLVWGYWDATSPIAVRVLDRRLVSSADALVRERLAAALRRRLEVLDAAQTNAFRWVHGEADALPGIHVDVYGQVAAVRYDGEGARAFYRTLFGSLLEVGRPALGLHGVVDRDRRGDAGEVEVRENGIVFIVDLAHGQKGGLFLDQRENREAIRARAAGRSVLNLFGYTGGFSLYAAAGGARRTDTVDSARPALESARRNFERNGFSLDAAGFHAVDAFAFLEAATGSGTRWDLVISDPPSFAPSRQALTPARKAYRRLHRLAAAVVAPGGIFCPASCSSHFPRDEFLASVEDGVTQAGRRFTLEALRGAAFDHPVLRAFPEGDYLKLAIGRLD